MKYSEGKIFNGFSTGNIKLIVSLPGNDPVLAVAAQNGGADMIKVHLNVTHAASGIHFGSFNEESPSIQRILDQVDIPVGIMPGAGTPASLEEMLELEEMGIAFFDIYISDMPPSYMEIEEMEPMAALGYGWSADEVSDLNRMGIKMAEASIVNHDEYGSPLHASDLLAYCDICEKFDGAVIVPTQKKIAPGEMPDLIQAGVSGLMIGKIVTGDSPASIEAATYEFSSALQGV